MHKVGFLHTAEAHVDTFQSLVESIRADVEVEHVVVAALLANAMAEGLTANVISGVNEALTALADSGVVAISCTCSTLGSVVEDRVLQTVPVHGQDNRGIPVQRIDRAVADHVMTFERILVVTALETATIAADELLQASARAAQSEARWLVALVPGAWDFFEAGDFTGYTAAIAAFVNESSQAYDAVFLAQASMQNAVSQCDHPHVFTSPKLGVERLLATLA